VVQDRAFRRPGRSSAMVPVVFLTLALMACGGEGRHSSRWDGRRGYDGNGDYGYDLAASRAEARGYRMRAGRTYQVPGTPNDPWGPHIREAAARFGVPELWIREVMRQETGGRLYDADGLPITSRAGAMGLMQVMPRTFDILQVRYGLGGDPYEPRDNILAGAAYIREMHDRYGAPGFLAAYNAGPNRVDAVLAGMTVLPDETENYVASIAPRLGLASSAGGFFATYAGGVSAGRGRRVSALVDDLAYAGGGMTGEAYFSSGRSGDGAGDPSRRAYDGGGLVTPDAPTGRLNSIYR
jgi:hypothetical protein